MNLGEQNSMDLESLRSLYDRQMRLSLCPFGMRREALPDLVRLTSDSPAASDNCIIHSQLSADSADHEIAQQVAHFSALGHAFEWKVYEHDPPADLSHRLQAAGFVLGPRESLLVLDLTTDRAWTNPPLEIEVRRLTRPEQLDDLIATRPDSERAQFASLAEWLAREWRDRPDQLAIYVAYVDGVPAAGAWLRCYPQADFADLWGGGTRPEFRRRGLYRALIYARYDEARRRGARYLTVDAGPESEPILRKLGFQVLAHCRAALWAPS